MGFVSWWKRVWLFRPGDPANRLHPRKYDLMYRFEDCYWWYVGMRRIQRTLVPELYASHGQNGFTVLDAGCGTGGRLLELPTSDMRVGMDLSCNALTYAGKRDLRDLVQAPIERLPFQANSFDAIIS